MYCRNYRRFPSSNKSTHRFGHETIALAPFKLYINFIWYTLPLNITESPLYFKLKLKHGRQANEHETYASNIYQGIF